MGACASLVPAFCTIVWPRLGSTSYIIFNPFYIPPLTPTSVKEADGWFVTLTSGSGFSVKVCVSVCVSVCICQLTLWHIA